MPFSMEGFAFFIEAIFLGIYLYSWDRISPRAHWLSGIPVAIAGALSGIFVVSANAWMNSPAGFDIVDGEVTNIDPVAAMLNERMAQQALHMTLAAYTATTFGVAGVYALGMLRGRSRCLPRQRAQDRDGCGRGGVDPAGDQRRYQRALGGPEPAREAGGNGGAVRDHDQCPADDRRDGQIRRIGETRWGIEIPGGLSFLADRDVNAEVQGLNDFPMDEQPGSAAWSTLRSR